MRLFVISSRIRNSTHETHSISICNNTKCVALNETSVILLVVVAYIVSFVLMGYYKWHFAYLSATISPYIREHFFTYHIHWCTIAL